MPISKLSCPRCGAPAAPDAVACDYCRSGLSAVACSSCFAPMFVETTFCTHCGVEAVREVLDEEKPLPCPKCRDEMRAVRLGQTTLRECPGCGGLWLDGVSFERICSIREMHGSVLSYVASLPGPESEAQSGPVRYLPCPGCNKLMNRVNFARCSGIIVDICKVHGVWFEHGELRRVIGFIDAGGLSVSREKERERLVEEQRRLRELQLSPTNYSAEWHAESAHDDVERLMRLLGSALGHGFTSE